MPRTLKAAVIVMFLASSLAFAQAPPVPSPAPGFITGVGNFSHIVADLEKSLAFYRDVIGLAPIAPPQAFSGNPAIMRLGNTPGAQSRMVQFRVPGSAMGVELIDYKDIDRAPAQPRFQDPGAANLILRVRDIDSIVERIRRTPAKILTAGGAPAVVNGGKYLFLQDLDGFIIELSQPATPPPATPDNSNIISGGFELTIADTDATVAFYRKVLGFQFTPGTTFNDSKQMTDTAGTPGASFKQSRGPIPGTNYNMTLIEFKNIDRKPLRTRVQDPGTAILQLMVKDMDGLMKELKASGAQIISTGGEAVSLGAGKLVIVRDPNNLFLEFIQR